MRKHFSNVLALFAMIATSSALFANNCVDFRTFYVSHGPGVGGSELYSVDLSGSEAELTIINEFSYEIHFAYGNESNLLYLVNANGSFVDFYDVGLNTVVSTLSLESGLSQLYQAVYNPNDGKLYVGSANQNKIFAIDLTDGSYTFVADAPIQGGDLVLKGEELFTLTRENDELRKVVGASTEFVANIADEVNGAALTAEGNIITANFQAGVFTVIDHQGNLLETIPVTRNGEPYTLVNGDMASGCREFEPIVEPEPCTDYRVYYININADETESTLYEVEISGSSASLTALETFGTSAHLGIGPDGLLYVVIGGGKLVIYDPSTNTASEPMQIAEVTGAPVINIPHVVVDQEDGTIYIASADTDAIYTVNPVTAQATFFASLGNNNVDVRGGDLVITADGTLWLVNRLDDIFYNIDAGGVAGFTAEGLNNINGAAILEDGTIIVANSGSSAFNLIDPATGMVMDAVIETDITFLDGDLAAGCASREPIEEQCQNFRTYYYNYIGNNDGQLFELTFSNGAATYAELSNFAEGSNHIALNDEGLIYSVRGSVIDIYDPATQSYVEQNIAIVDASTNASLTGFPAAVIDKAGTLWLGRGANNTVYTIEFTGGQAKATAQFSAADGIIVDGGDLVVTEDEEGTETLWLANRTNNTLYNLTAGGSLELPLPEVNGVSTTVDGALLLANGMMNATGGLYKWNPTTGELEQLSNDGGPQTFFNGDLAARCLDTELEGCPDYQVYYTGYPAINGSNTNVNELYRVTVMDGEATFDIVNGFSSADNHIALTSTGLIYAVSVTRNTVDIFNPATETYVQQNIPLKNMGASLTGGPALAVDSSDKLWMATDNDRVYSIEFIGGEAIATLEFTGTPISGGDLIFTIGEEGEDVLWHINRTDNTLYNFNDGSSILVGLPEINGAAVLEDGRLVFANGEDNANGGLWAYDVATATLEQLTGIGGPNIFDNGDMAGGCVTVEAQPAPQGNFTSMSAQEAVQGNTRLSNFPNPTEGLNTVVFETASEERTVLQIFDMTGREVATLFNQVTKPGMEYRVDFDASALPLGIYIYRLNTGDQMIINKVMVK